MLDKKNDQISFRLATPQDRTMIKEWWTKPHVMEFWNNSPGMWQWGVMGIEYSIFFFGS